MKPGQRVRLIRTTDPHTDLKPGDMGEIIDIDDTGTVHVKWSNGSRLGMIGEAGDRLELIKEEGK